MAQRQFRTDDTSGWSDRFGYGSDGAYAPSTGTDAPTDSACTGTSGTTSLSATNGSFATGQLILIHQTQGTGAGQWELNKIASYTAGTITTAYSLINTYATGAQVLVMPQYSSGNIAGGVTLTGKAWNGTVGGIYAKFCNGTFTVAGAITLTEKGFRGGADSGYQGEGSVGAGAITTAANGNAGGGGGNPVSGSGGGGGAGGHANAGTAGSSAGGSGGTAGTGSLDNASLTTLLFGGAGGAGGADGGATNRCGLGGRSGGIVLIISKKITLTGSIALAGGNGLNARDSSGGGGAPGAAGACLLKGQTLVLGSSLITAPVNTTAGTGLGGGATGGQPSSVGRIHADYSFSVSGTTSPTLDSSQDSIYIDRGGAFLFGMI